MKLVLCEDDLRFSDRYTCVYYYTTSISDFYHKKMLVMFDKITSKYSSVDFCQLDIDRINNAKDRFLLKKVPTVILFNSGKEIARLEGLPLTQAFKNFFKKIES